MMESVNERTSMAKEKKRKPGRPKATDKKVNLQFKLGESWKARLKKIMEVEGEFSEAAIIRGAVTDMILEKEKEHGLKEEEAQEALRRFMLARIGQNEAIAKFYLTEKAMEQTRLKEFSLIDEFSSYEILEAEKIEEGKYRFIVNMHYKDLPIKLTEIITLLKVLELDEYYVDSIQIAG